MMEILKEADEDSIAIATLYRAYKKIGASSIRTSFGVSKFVYWTMMDTDDEHLLCVEMTPIDEIHHEWVREILEDYGYEEVDESEKEIPDKGEWFVREGRYYWLEKSQGHYQAEDSGEDEQDRGVVL